MSTPPDLPEGGIPRTTRSGRAVRPPLRYEPDPDQILDDDFSDTLSDDEWGFREEEPQTEDGDADDLTDSDEGDFTAQESHDSSYESASDTSPSEDEQGDDDDEDEDEGEDEDDQTDREDECDDMEDIDDILEWETLTADASDHYSSDDDQDV